MKRSGNVRNNSGWWAKPGGKIEYGETAIKMVKREIKEETNINIEVWGQLPHTDHIIKKEGQHWVAINFIANYKKGALKNKETHKYEEIRWFSLNKLPKKIEQTIKESIKNYVTGKYIKL